MIHFVHPTGNANVRSALNALEKHQLLYRFTTSSAVFSKGLLSSLSGISIFQELKRRSFPDALQSYTQQYSCKEWGRMISSRMGWKQLIEHEKGLFCIDAVYQNLDKKVSKKLNKQTDAVYGYEDGIADSFEAAKKMGITCLYDLPIGYWRAARELLESERTQHPEWAATLTGFRDSASKLQRKDRELALADHIFVASSFTASTLAYYPGTLAPVSVIPYGFPPVCSNREYKALHKRKLNVLFVGGLSQRKGIAYLFEALQGLEDRVSLTVIGQKVVPDCTALNTALEKHRWIPSLPHAEILQQMKEHDVLIFPSLFEGFGLVITEAMSQGTPVITTDRTAGPDLITDGKNGWLIDAGSSQAIQDKLLFLLSHPEDVERVGKNAMRTAAARPWEKYGEELVEKIRSIKQ